MARWRLTEKHYLYTDPPTEWEQKETDLATGEEVRKRFEVPKYLNPDEPRDQTPRGSGECIVCWKGKGKPTDVVFKGPPTTAMAPIDEEAQQITDSMSVGEHPIEDLPTQIEAPQPDILRQMQAQINALMLANDELQRRVATSSGDATADAAAIASQSVPVAKSNKPDSVQRPERRV